MEGKATSSHNAWQGGVRPLIRELEKELREQDKTRCQLYANWPE